MQTFRRGLRPAAALVAAVALLLAAPTPAASLSTLREAPSAVEATAPLVAVAALLAWLLLAWLLVTAGLTVVGAVPGAAGRTAAAAARRIAPLAVRQLVGAALGFSVAAGVLTAGTASAAGPAATAPMSGAGAAQTQPATGTVSLDWSGIPAAVDLDWPTSPAGRPAADDGPADLPAGADRAAATAPTAAPTPPTSPRPVLAAPVGRADDVVVQPGDTLWAVAEQQLTQRAGDSPGAAQVAAAWPSWWAANREVVGDDPDLLLPGTTLQPPDVAPSDPPD